MQRMTLFGGGAPPDLRFAARHAFYLDDAHDTRLGSHDLGTPPVARTDHLAQLILRAQQNDQGAYEQLYNRYVDQLFRFLYVRCGNASLAEEALGELWLRVVQYLPGFRVPSEGADQAFVAWLYTIARNLIIDSLRASQHDGRQIPDDLPAAETDLDLHIDRRDSYLALAAAVDQLTPEQREVILLRFREDLTSSEVALRTGRSESAVKALQHRALGTLARMMGVTRASEHGRDRHERVIFKGR
jgi:RNA polymerase sigma-70 factor, ECF subfamily